MEIIHKINLNESEQEKIKFTKNDINVHKFLITIPDFLDLLKVDVLINIRDIFGNCMSIKDVEKNKETVSFVVSSFFKSTGTRNCEVVFFNDNQMYHSEKFSYYVDYNLDCKDEDVDFEEYSILIEIINEYKNKVSETEKINEDVISLYNKLQEILESGQFDGRTLEYKIDGTKLGFKYTDEDDFEWVEVESTIPQWLLDDIEKKAYREELKAYMEYEKMNEYIKFAEDTSIRELFYGGIR